MKLLSSSSNFHAGTGSSDIKYQQLSSLGLWPLLCTSVLPTKLSQLLTVKVGPLHIMKKNKNVNIFAYMGFTFLPRGNLKFLPREKCEAPWGECEESKGEM